MVQTTPTGRWLSAAPAMVLSFVVQAASVDTVDVFGHPDLVIEGEASFLVDVDSVNVAFVEFDTTTWPGDFSGLQFDFLLDAGVLETDGEGKSLFSAQITNDFVVRLDVRRQASVHQDGFEAPRQEAAAEYRVAYGPVATPGSGEWHPGPAQVPVTLLVERGNRAALSLDGNPVESIAIPCGSCGIENFRLGMMQIPTFAAGAYVADPFLARFPGTSLPGGAFLIDTFEMGLFSWSAVVP